ncbi:sushi, von Willebrand factor type A, EGF and pentraxin domain-containing protein 1-like [Dreissena polymorpha]|uniref:sushi, von Willebrand factor type A, EGF and pentraxin domain-containing protein 1-like n=1 Tax=Dreissena polymorpha TaxID=45954 RepID=UPI0022651D8D|nr:sushi, von Willebrand factor type A, EGF and pentraxin domain-containing protein 1-like [Dreissena polymorpha]
MCLDAYKLKDNNVLQCAYDGAWQGKRPECVEITCGPPPVFDHAFTSMSVGAAIGSEATFVCNERYYLVGSARAICLANKTWRYENDVPTCRPIDCRPPPKVPHASSTFTSTLYEALVAYDCDLGYRMASGSQLRCSSAGTWVGPSTKYEPVTCGKPPSGEHMTVIGNSSTYGSAVSYQCASGYELTHEKKSVCLGTGSWSVSSPACLCMRCQQLRIPENGITVNGHFNTHNRYGDRIVLGCANGYKMIGEASLQCMENGSWNNGLPTCKPIYPVCRKPCACGGRCVAPNKCLCNHGYSGAFCESKRRA